MNSTLKRAISGTGFIGIILLCLLVNKYLFAVLMLFIEVTMLLEFYRMTMEDKFKFSRLLSLIASGALFILFFISCAFQIPFMIVSVSMIPMIVVMIDSLYVKDKDEFWRFSFIYTSIMYISFPLALSNLIVFSEGVFDGLPLLCFFIIIWASDVGAYYIGCNLGRYFPKKLFEEISPKKTWIGFAGGMVAAILATIILKLCGLFSFSAFHCFMLAVVMDIAGVYGDLFESQWKRCFGVKDSGNIIPGHGGMMDRFDSALFAIPAGVLYLVLFNVI